MSLKETLEGVDPLELETFVLQYAKGDKSFEIILKAHFISRLETGDAHLKYHKILTEIVKPRTLANPKLSASTKRTINIILQDFSFQMSDLLSIEDYKEAFYIITNALDKISYLQNSYKLTDKTLDKLRIDFLGGLQIILNQDLAPTFRSKMEGLLISNVKKSYYLPSKYNLLCLLDDNHVLSETDKKVLLDDLIKKLDEQDEQQNIIMAMIQLSVPLPELTNKMLGYINHDKIFLALSELVSLRKFRIVEYFLENKKVNYNLYNTAIGCMIQHQKEDFQKLTQSLITITTENTPLLILKDVINHLSANYLRQEFANLKAWITLLPFGLRCSIYSKIGHYDELAAALKDHGQIEWVKVYDTLLIEQGYKELVKEIYLHCSTEYLNNHLGTKALEYMSKVNQRLTSISEHKMLNEIQESLYQKFSHRINMP